MSIDYWVYLKQRDLFSVKSFEEYCNSIGLCITMDPSVDLSAVSGYVPIRFTDKRFSNVNTKGDFLSGFEMYFHEYHEEIQPQKKPVGFFRKLFPPKPEKESSFSLATRDSRWMIALNCSSADSFEIFLAYVFGSYLIKCGGVFDDPQSGRFYDNSKAMETEIAANLEELLRQAADGELIMHPFESWQ